MTTRSFFPLLIALAGLAVGCKDGTTDKPAKALTMQEPAKMAPALPKQEEAPALTAVAPTTPPSVTDMPKGDDPPKEPKKVPKDVELTLGVQEIFHEDPDAIDFDRPLDAKDVVLDRFVLATDVSGREPVEESDHFAADNEKIFAFVQLANKDAPYAFTVHFEKVDGPKSLFGVKLDVPSAPRYRTWAWTKLVHEPGKYRAVLRTLEGEEIAAREFTIDEAL